MNAMVATLIGLIMLGLGYYVSKRKDVFTAYGTAKVGPGSSCQMVSSGRRHGGYSWSCGLQLQYEINGKQYQQAITTSSSTSYSQGQTVNIAYNPDDPRQVEIEPAITQRHMGWLLMAAGVALVVLPWAWVYMTQRSEALAELAGARAFLS